MTSQTSTPPSEVPSLIAGRYEVLKVLGTGPAGTVYRVRDTELDEVVALKLFRALEASNAQARDRLRDTFKRARALSHPHISRTFDVGDHEGARFITTEYIEGESLAALMDRGPMPVLDAVAIGLAIADALGAAHDAQLLHAGLTPANVVRDQGGRVVVTDFASPRVAMTAAGQGSGQDTRFLAPEQLLDREAVDARADVFALGTILYQLMVGDVTRPCAAATGSDTVADTSEAPDLQDRVVSAPVSLAQTLRRMMSARPEERPRNGREAADLLRSELDLTTPRAPGPRSVRSGETVSGRFRLEQEVAVGGGGRVFRAHDTLSGVPVALKFMLPVDEEGAVRFKRESLILARVSHPGLVRYVAHGIDAQENPWLATEWLEGEDLRRHVSRRLDVATAHGPRAAAVPGSAQGSAQGALRGCEVMPLMRRLASALDSLHMAGLVHRDIKPSNIYLVGGQTAHAKLIDLGAARNAGSVGDLTRTGYVVGTTTYMAPEQAQGERELTPAADVWSLGCVIYECLTGSAPFRGQSTGDTLRRIIHESPPSLHSMGVEAPESLLALIHQMLTKDPRRRPQNGAELLAALEGVWPQESPAVAHTVESSLGETELRFGCSLIVAACAAQPDFGLLHNEVEAAGLRAELLSATRCVVRLPAADALTDQAARGARLALALRTLFPDWSFLLTSGTYISGGVLPAAQVSERDAVNGATDKLEVLLARARPGWIAVDARTTALIESRFNMTMSGDLHVLADARDGETTRTLMGRPTRTVGRKRELGLLDATWAECVDEPRARVVLVTAPAGVGKTRLRTEFLHSLRLDRVAHTLLHCQGDALSAGSPFTLIGPALRRAAGIHDSDALELRRHKLSALVSRAIDEPSEARRTAAFLGEVIGVPYDDERDTALQAARHESMLLAEQACSAFVAFVRAEAKRHPVLLLIDDLHWGDRPSVRFIDAALGALRSAPVMVLALARPEVHDIFPTLWNSHAVDEVRLEPLGRRACIELVREVVGDALSDREVEAIVDRSGGNPLFLEEVVRAVLLDGGTMGESLPATVVGMLHARLAAMGPEPRRILRAASVFGESFRASGVRFLAGEGGDGYSLSDWLDELCRREVILATSDEQKSGDIEYRFRHALFRDAAYTLLTEEDRAKAHRLAGQWLEQTGERDPQVLASHYQLGGHAQHAQRCFTDAAEAALGGNDFEGALQAIERAKACGAAGEDLGQLYALSASARYWQSRYREAADDGGEALRLAKRGSGPWFRACGSALVSCARLGDFAAFDDHFNALRFADAQPGMEADQLVSLCRGTFQLIFRGRFVEADTTLELIGRLACKASGVDALTRAQMSHVRGARAAIVGDVGTFLSHLEDAVAAFEDAGDISNVSLERTTIGWCYAELGLFEHAIRRIRENLDSCRVLRAQQAITYAKVNLGYALERVPRYAAEASVMLRDAIAETNAVANPRLEGWARGHLASLNLRQGDPANAEVEARAACMLLKNAPSLYGWVRALAARAYLGLGRTDDALAAALEARDVLHALGGLLQGASLPLLVLAEVHAAMGHIDEARQTAFDAHAFLMKRAERLPQARWRSSFLAVEEHAATIALARSHGLETGADGG